ncbi:helix-turn-helix domain-containing protein [Rothia sp. CCM 9417]|uniref:helix-turn-helix domain-containing protein n=1 Tax=Rothia sp. CCM 9417 TaxID=3402657 RepID=UPI003AEA6343
MSKTNALGFEIQKARFNHGFSRLDLTSKSGVASPTIQAIEEGKRYPKISTLIQISKGIEENPQNQKDFFFKLLEIIWEESC